jgi:metal-responsive CopG/Arc/MetJ family transcriptional regulator
MAPNVAPDKTRVNFTIPKKLKKQLEKQAEKENRSFSNMIVVAIEEYLRQKANK